MLACHLLKHKTIHVSLLGPEAEYLTGAAYRTDQPNVCFTNVPAGRMSAWPNEPDHFVRWLQGPRGQKWGMFGAQDVVPRKAYGKYLYDVLQEVKRPESVGRRLTGHFRMAIRAFKEGIVDENAVSFYCHEHWDAPTHLYKKRAKHSSTGWKVLSETGMEFGGTHFVLATGLPGPRTLPIPAQSNAVVIQNPMQKLARMNIDRKASVLMVGSGLMALDALNVLKSKKHLGHVTVLSPHGFFPQPHVPLLHMDLDVESLLKTETTLLGQLKSLKRHLNLHQTENTEQAWISLVHHLRPWTSRIWQGWSTTEKQQFLRHLRPLWNAFRHRAAQESMQGLEWFRATRKITVIRERIEGWKGKADVIINCTSPDFQGMWDVQPLYQGLFIDGHICKDPLGLGIRCDSRGRVISKQGEVHGNLYAMGALRVGDLWESTAVAELRIQAQELAQIIAQG